MSVNKFIAALILALPAPSVVRACDVPVFKYALERWPADPYRVEISPGADKTAVKKIMEYLKPFEDDFGVIHIVDSTEGSVPGRPAFPKIPKNAPLGVAYPVQSKVDRLACSAPLSLDDVKRVMDSPIRRKIAEKLLKGAAAVFLQVDPSDPKRGDAVFKNLRTALDECEKEINESLSAAPDGKAEKIRFASIRVERSDPKEKYFMAMLFNLDNELPNDEPLVFPIYGRGRVLLALSGKGVNKDNLYDVCAFFTGSCSCEVKAMNPGYDLLIPVKWDEYIYDDIKITDALPPLTALSAAAEAVAKAETPNEQPPTPSREKKTGEKEPSSNNALIANLFFTVALLVVAGIAMAWRAGRSKNGAEEE